ncbi:hypothetical protein ONZ43_g5923 [Nemania bipapillata]|uniref:Uncharacterized protein n=1 Tax=Nemania bipapillata TaxID=110536 RepID=A0ACC2I4N2_9PEZI|nr:hypothetical protein ONZ43_g5923 [Nemania bipapillata]
MDSPIKPFSPERCADLHNQLLAKAAEHDPNAAIERTLVARFLETTPEFDEPRSLYKLPWYRFLSLLDTTPSLPDKGANLLTPFMYQPDPSTFWTNRPGQEATVVLLYAQNNGDSPVDGGVYIDIHSHQAIWYNGSSPNFPSSFQWLPLEVILEKALDAWDTGKFYWDTQEAIMKARSWTQYDVEQSVEAFHRLLSTMESSPFMISTFAVKFLTTATQPDFTFVAPGIRALTPSLLEEIYGPEAPDSVRRMQSLWDEDWPTLILPGVDPVPQDVGNSTKPEINTFDQDWGFGKFTVNRQSGLYIMPDVGNADQARFVADSGLCTAGEFRYPCRWGPSREPKLAEIFDRWAELVKEGIWTVEENGVSTDHSWFTEYTGLGKPLPSVKSTSNRNDPTLRS